MSPMSANFLTRSPSPIYPNSDTADTNDPVSFRTHLPTSNSGFHSSKNFNSLTSESKQIHSFRRGSIQSPTSLAFTNKTLTRRQLRKPTVIDSKKGQHEHSDTLFTRAERVSSLTHPVYHDSRIPKHASSSSLESLSKQTHSPSSQTYHHHQLKGSQSFNGIQTLLSGLSHHHHHHNGGTNQRTLPEHSTSSPDMLDLPESSIPSPHRGVFRDLKKLKGLTRRPSLLGKKPPVSPDREDHAPLTRLGYLTEASIPTFSSMVDLTSNSHSVGMSMRKHARRLRSNTASSSSLNSYSSSSSSSSSSSTEDEVNYVTRASNIPVASPMRPRMARSNSSFSAYTTPPKSIKTSMSTSNIGHLYESGTRLNQPRFQYDNQARKPGVANPTLASTVFFKSGNRYLKRQESYDSFYSNSTDDDDDKTIRCNVAADMLASTCNPQNGIPQNAVNSNSCGTAALLAPKPGSASTVHTRKPPSGRDFVSISPMASDPGSALSLVLSDAQAPDFDFSQNAPSLTSSKRTSLQQQSLPLTDTPFLRGSPPPSLLPQEALTYDSSTVMAALSDGAASIRDSGNMNINNANDNSNSFNSNNNNNNNNHNNNTNNTNNTNNNTSQNTNMSSSLPPINSGDSNLNTLPDATSGYPFLRALHSFDATTLFSSTSDEDPSSVCLSFVEAELVLLHSIHPSGWGDATILATGARGWIPTNYFTPYSEPKVVPVLSAVLNFVLAPKSQPLPKPKDTSYTFSPAAISAIVAGVRSLLESCGALTRDTSIVRKSPSIRKFRKILLAELAILVSLAKQYKYTTDDADIARLVAGSYKIIFRAVVFLDIWSMGISSGDSEDHDKISPARDPSPSKDAVPETSEPGNRLSKRPSISISPSIDNIRARFAEDSQLPAASSPSSGSSSAPLEQSPLATSSLVSPTAVAPVISRTQSSNRDSVIFHPTPPHALQRLDEVNNALTAYLGNFLHRTSLLESDPTACTQILVNTRKSMLACRELLAAVEAVSSRFLPRNKDLENCKDLLFGKIRALVTAARDVVASTPSTANDTVLSSPAATSKDDSDGEMDTLPTDDDTITSQKKKPSDLQAAFERETKRLIEIAVDCSKTSNECVLRCRQIIDVIGDFQLSAQREYPDFSDGIIAANLGSEKGPLGLAAIAPSNTTLSVPEEDSDSTFPASSDDQLHKYSGSLTSEKTDATLVNGSARDAKHASLLPRIPAISPLIPVAADEAEAAKGFDAKKTDTKDGLQRQSYQTPAPLQAQKRVRGHAHTHSQPLSAFANAPVSANTTAPLPGADAQPAEAQTDGKRLRSVSAPNTGPEADGDGESVPEEAAGEDAGDEQAQAARNARVQKLIDELPLEDRILKDAGTGRVRAGTLESFVKHLTDDTTAEEADPFFLTAFFLTFRQFTTPAAFATALFARFEVGGMSGPGTSLVLSSRSTDPTSRRRAKVYNILKRWMESHWRQSADGAVLCEVAEFARTRLAQYQPATAQTVIADLAARLPQQKEGAQLAPRIIAIPGAQEVRREAMAYANTTPVVSLVSRHQVSLLVKAVESAEEAEEGKGGVLETVSTGQTLVASQVSGAPSDETKVGGGGEGDERDKPLPPPPAINPATMNPANTATNPTNAASGSAWTQSLRMVRNNALGIGHPVVSLLDIDAYEIAKQVTLMDSELVAQVRPEELLDNNFSMKKRHLNLAPHVTAVALFTNQLSAFVSDSLLVPETPPKARQKLLKHWIKVAERFLELRNFNSLMTVVSALQSVNVKRLRKTWEGLSQRHLAAFQRLKTLLAIDKNYSNYRAELRAATVPCSPYFGLYLTDLTFNSEGNHPLKTLTLDPQTRAVIPCSGKPGALAMLAGNSRAEVCVASFSVTNFDRYDRTTRIIGELQNFQCVPYRIVACAELQAWLKVEMQKSHAVVTADSNGLWKRSNLVEPKGS